MLEERLSVSTKIEQLKNEKGYSYRKLADLTGISYVTIMRYVNNPNIKISITNLNKIAKAFNVSQTYLLGYSEREDYIERSDDCPLLDEIIKKLKNFTDEQMDDAYDYICYLEKRNK